MMVLPGGERPDGFTLLELLVALTVLGFLLVGLAQGVHFGLLTWGTEVRLASGNDSFATLDDTVRHIVEAADPGDDINPTPFVASADLVDTDHRLVLRWLPYVHAMRLGPPPARTETELVHDVSQIELAFWRNGGGWVSTWRSPDLPALVRVRLRFAAGDPRHWPDIIAAPILDRP